jgi:Fe-S cluster biogenesis protein NfuA
MSDERIIAAPVAIRAEPTLSEPDVCRFIVSRDVHPGGPWYYATAAEAAGSPLPERLFALPGVRHVLVAGSVVTVGKTAEADWAALKKAIGVAIRSQLATGVPAILESARSAGGAGRSDDEIRAQVEQLLAREVNPSIAAHGGRIVLDDVRDRELYIRMEGGCQGCASSQFTLRQGFEVMVRRVLPEVVAIIDVTDHAAGRDPFYRRSPPG